MTGEATHPLAGSAVPRDRRLMTLAMSLAAACLCWCPVSLAAEEQGVAAQPGVSIVAVRAGFAGRFKVGSWTPFEITLAGGQQPVTGRVELTVLDGDGVPSRVRALQGELTIAAGQRVVVPLYAKIGQLEGPLTVGFHSADGKLFARHYHARDEGPLAGMLPSSRRLVVTLGAPLVADDELPLDQRGVTVANVDDVGKLPVDWWGYEGVDTVVVATGGDAASEQLLHPSPQIAALAQWVTMGGRLILSAGRRAETVLAASSPWAVLAPGEFDSRVPLRQGTPFETYAETSEPLGGGGLTLEVPKLRNVRGKIEAYAGNHPRDLPLVVRTPHGFGQVVFVAFDIERPPFADWRARAQLLEKLLPSPAARALQGDSQSLGQVTTLGFDDLAGQLRGALDQFAGVQLVPFWLVALLVVVYIACIGPLDYFVIKKLLGRMEATWLTLAVTLFAFCAGAWALAYVVKGRELRVNRVDLVDFDAPTNLVRGTSWACLFSPETDAYDLSLVPANLEPIREPASRGGQSHFAPRAPQNRDSPRRFSDRLLVHPVSPGLAGADSAGVLLSWLGLSGAGFGGMDATTRGASLFTQAYDFSPELDRLDRVPIAVWSSKAFVGRWWRPGGPPVEAQLGDKGRLVGTLTNRLDQPLDDCVLFYDRWAYPLRQFKPGRSIDVETDVDPQRVDTYLRQMTVQGDRNVTTPYDRTSFDIPRIVEMMTAYELAGGQVYTGLAHENQGFVEMSGLVRNGRAVLVGRGAVPVVRLARAGAPLEDAAGAHWIFYRVVFEVSEGAAAGSSRGAAGERNLPRESFE